MKLAELLHGREVDDAELVRVRDVLLFDRPPQRDRLVRFTVLLGLSAIIGTGGVLLDSTATVIGAMIVAPLMTPIMATAFSVSTGDAPNIRRSLAIVAAGAAGVIAIAWLMTLLVPGTVDTLNNSQITSRTTVDIMAFVVAIASGAAGAFAVSRVEVSDALPGVAIAISLVPPLAVVGVCLSVGSFAQAAGALLLFTTNFLAILVAGGAFFALSGYGKIAFETFDAKAARIATIAIVLAVVVVLIPLGVTSYELTNQTLLNNDVTSATRVWLGGTGYRLLHVRPEAGGVEVAITGSGPRPRIADLKSALALRRRTSGARIEVRVVPNDLLGTLGGN